MVIGDLSTAVDVLVLGGGPGGYSAAIRAAQLGQQVALVEPGPLGGTCLNLGCIPAKALLSAADYWQQLGQLGKMGITIEKSSLDFTRMQHWKDGIVQRLSKGVEQLLQGNKIQLVQGKGWFISESDVRIEGEHGSQRFSFSHCIIATGAEFRALDNLAFSEHVLTPGQALSLNTLPDSIAIVGSDYITAELATLFAKLQVATQLLVPAGQTLLADFDPLAARQVRAGLKKLGVKFITDRQDFTGIDTSIIVLSVGLTPRSNELELQQVQVNTDEHGFITVNQHMQSSNPSIYAVGDCSGGLPLATLALKQGKVAAEHSAGRASQFMPQAIPLVAWTDPMIACVGLDIAAAKAAGYDAINSRFPLAANGRALTLNNNNGFAIITADRDSGILLGATLVGEGAEAVISEAALALEMGATVTDLAETLHPHPGLAEPLQEAAEAALGLPTHILLNTA